MLTYITAVHMENHNMFSPDGIIEGELKLKRKFLIRNEKLVDALMKA